MSFATSLALLVAASPAAGFTFSANADCSSPVTQLTLNTGQSSRVLYVRGTSAGSVTVTASRTGFTNGTLAVTVNPAAPTQLTYQTASQTVEAGSCSGITAVQVRDAFGNAVPVSANTQITLTGSTMNLTFYSDAGCTNPATALTVPAGQSSVSFYFRDHTVESVTITASSPGLTSATQSQTIRPVPPTELSFATSPQTVAQGSAVFYFRGNIPGAVTTTASSMGLTSASQVHTITGGVVAPVSPD